MVHWRTGTLAQGCSCALEVAKDTGRQQCVHLLICHDPSPAFTLFLHTLYLHTLYSVTGDTVPLRLRGVVRIKLCVEAT